MSESTGFRPLAVSHIKTATHPGKRMEVYMQTQSSWWEIKNRLNEEYPVRETAKSILGPSLLLDYAITQANVSFLRKFHPHLKILTNDTDFEDFLRSKGIEKISVPITYHLDDHDPWQVLRNGTPSFIIDSGSFDPLWFEDMASYSSEGIALNPVYLLSSKQIPFSDLKDIFGEVNDVDDLMNTLLGVFDVLFFSDREYDFIVMTKDPEVVAFLERAPKSVE